MKKKSKPKKKKLTKTNLLISVKLWEKDGIKEFTPIVFTELENAIGFCQEVLKDKRNISSIEIFT